MRLDGAEETEALGRRIAAALRPGDVVALSGELGAGKTTLARGILRGLGFEGDVASPTFPIVIPYGPPDTSFPLWHVDLYRIEKKAEIEELALDDGLEDSVLLVEWPELALGLWPDALRLEIRHSGGLARALTAAVPAAWEKRWPLP
jgi:tRNA threonylcarbamoyladenosine biosynthesis protein TsaE